MFILELEGKGSALLKLYRLRLDKVKSSSKKKWDIIIKRGEEGSGKKITSECEDNL